jgi:hypothetical protein
MLMSAVVHPEAFASTHFDAQGYRDHVEMFLRGMQSNGVLLVDSDKRLLNALSDQIDALGTKCGQQIRIRFEELRKPGRSRVVVTRCRCNATLNTLEAARAVHDATRSDGLIVSPDTTRLLQSGIGSDSDELTSMAAYISSAFETSRHMHLEHQPLLDQMGSDAFAAQIIRLTRFSKRLRFYDKQIGADGNLQGFRRGLGRILSLWTANAYHVRTSLTAEIYTCVQATQRPTEVVYQRLKDDIAAELSNAAGVQIGLFLKDDPGHLTHDRYLQTDSLAVYFSKGFDFLDRDGSLHRCSMRVDNTAHEHLSEYRGLSNHLEPSLSMPHMRR